MFQYLFLVSIVFFGISYGIDYVWESEPHYAESKKVFLNAFVKCYNRIPLHVLRQPSHEAMVQWLDAVFDEVYRDYRDRNSSLWLSAKSNDRTIGFLVINTAKYPDEIYLAQLAVDPAFQRQGIATAMIRELFAQFSQCAKFVVITRCANEEARGFYTALHFIPSSYLHEGYSHELYSGFEIIGRCLWKRGFKITLH
jgi:ribosomal protein S18 acetylase RimI-like enzyme